MFERALVYIQHIRRDKEIKVRGVVSEKNFNDFYFS